MPAQADWTRRASYIQQRHGIQAAWASEAVADDHAVWLVPDPASRSGHAVRVIGYSVSAGKVLAVILVAANADPESSPTGTGGAATLGQPIGVTCASTERWSDEQD